MTVCRHHPIAESIKMPIKTPFKTPIKTATKDEETSRAAE